MSRVKGRNTKPELFVRSLVHRMGYRFRLHRRDLPGVPDLVLPRHRKIIFVHGCFWHQHEGCSRANRPSTNKKFWNDKLDANVKRDQENLDALAKMGWVTLIIWECETRQPHVPFEKLRQFLSS